MTMTVHMHLIVYIYGCEFRDEIILRGEECKTQVNLDFKMMKRPSPLGSSHEV